MEGVAKGKIVTNRIEIWVIIKTVAKFETYKGVQLTFR